MNDIRRVWLMQSPSKAGAAWREAFAAACAEHDWTFSIHEKGEKPPEPDPARSHLTVSWLDWAEGHPVTDWYVQRGAAEDSAYILAERDNLSQRDALYEGSLRLACAELMIQNGAGIVSVDDEIITLSGLGEIRRPAEALRTTSDPRHPLYLYHSAPLKAGTKVHWGPEHFNYADAASADALDGAIKLVGRRRLLFSGPNIFLPPGHWRVEAELSIDPPGETEFLIEWGFGDQVQSIPAVISRPGRYSVVMEQRWTHVACADFRISLIIPALDGHLAFSGITLTRLDDA
jgi:hypothetical protein